MRESATAKARRLQHAMRELSRMPDGAQPWAITGIAGYVADGLTFEQAVREEQRDAGFDPDAADHTPRAKDEPC